MTRYLADKSALTRATIPAVSARLTPLLQAGQVATCGVVELEVLFSARSANDLNTTRRRRAIAYDRIPMLEQDFTRAEEVMALLALRGHHRAVSLPDLLIAAVAERASLTILHYDADFDIVTSATGQSTEWVAPKGSL